MIVVLKRNSDKEHVEKLMQHSTEGITDDAMVVEQEMGIESVMVKGGYENIKITTPEDLLVAESFLAEK